MSSYSVLTGQRLPQRIFDCFLIPGKRMYFFNHLKEGKKTFHVNLIMLFRFQPDEPQTNSSPKQTTIGENANTEE